jgi:hypothetical protein
MAQQPGQQQVVVVEPIRVFDPFFAYPYPYAYPPDYMAPTFGYVKIKTDRKDASVFVDGGFADKVAKAKKFALRPGNHNIELRDSDNRTIYKEQVAVTVGKTGKAAAGHLGLISPERRESRGGLMSERPHLSPTV